MIDPRPPSDARRDAERHRGAAEVAQARVVEAMGRRDPVRAENLAREAADRLDELARSLPETAPEPDPDDAPLPEDPTLTIGDDEAMQAVALARRERRLREQLQALLADRIPDQEAIRDDTAALAREIAELRDRVQQSSPRGRGPAAEAAQLLGQNAPPMMEQSTRQLARGEQNAARDTQRRAAETLQRAAQRAEDLAVALRADGPPEPERRGSPRSRPPSPLADAQDAQQRAAQQLAEARAPSSSDRPPAGGAAESMRQAAEGLRTASQPTTGPEALARAAPATRPARPSRAPPPTPCPAPPASPPPTSPSCNPSSAPRPAATGANSPATSAPRSSR